MISLFASDTLARKAVAACLIALLALPLQLPVMLANPSGGNVAAGSAQIQTGPGNVTVRQSSQRAIIQWNDFSVQHGDTTTFVQPNSSAATLNRVTGGSASQINGALNANGKVYLVNPNGVVIGKTGRVNTGSFTVSTHDVADSEFLGGGDMTFRGNSGASIINQGKIKATAGDVTLIARHVENSGKIRAKNGSVNLAGGTEVLLKPDGEQRVFIRSSGNSGSGTVSNSGSIRATAAELRAAGGNEYALAVNNSGVIRATAVDRSGGRIVLKAQGGSVVNSGRLVARGTAPGKSGGKVAVTGDHVRLTSTSRIDAGSVYAKGGEVAIGGGFQGKDASVSNAKTTVVEAGSVISVDGQPGAATLGGTAIIWSDERTDFLGAITARDGGFAEVSSKGVLAFRGAVDTSGGTLLLDPASLTISNGLTTNPASPTSSTVDSVLNVTDLLNLLASGNVTLQASDFIVVSTAVGSSGSPINNNLTFNTATLYLNAPITMGTGVISGSGSLLNVYVNPGALIQNGVDAVATAGSVWLGAGTFAENSIQISKALTINGTGASTTIIDGTDTARVLTINAPAGQLVRMNGVTLTGGNTVVSGTDGGGLYIVRGNVAISNTTFLNNTSGSSGGGIYSADSGSIALDRVTFSGNVAGLAGGGLTSAAVVTITNSLFTGNTANNSVGGALFYQGDITLSIKDTIFNGNTAQSAGAIAMFSGTANISGSTFSGNMANFGSAGAINNNGTLNIADSVFSGNTSTDKGGAIYNQPAAPDLHNITITNSTFRNNSAARQGGAIFSDTGNTISIRGSLFDANSVTSITVTASGGAIWTSGGTVTITDTILRNNTSPSDINTQGGGAIYSSGTTLSLNRTTLDSNSANQGGALYLNGGDITIDNSTLKNNTANTAGGGGIYTRSSALSISDSVLADNQTSGVGGGINAVRSTLNVTRSTLQGNRSAYDGGGIYSLDNSLSVEDSTFDGNVAANRGGGIYSDQVSGSDTSVISGSLFIRNTADYGGGLWNATPTTLSNSTFTLNVAASDGGAIRVEGFSNALTATSLTIAYNTANYGGGISQGNGTFSIRNSIVTGNNALVSSSDDIEISSYVYNTTDAGYNLIDTGDPFLSTTGPSTWNVTSNQAGLGPLGWYGGPTQTFTLLYQYSPGVTWPAQNGGDPTLAGTLDQRGRVRNANAFGGVDVGAFEAHSDGGEYYVSKTADDGTAGTLRFGIDATDFAEKPNYIGFKIAQGGTGYDPAAGIWTIATAAGQFLVTRAMTIDGTTQPGYVPNSGKPLIILDGNGTNRVMRINPGSGVKVTLDGLGITNGGVEASAGVLINNGDVTIQNSSIYGNHTTVPVGAITVTASSKLTLIHSTVANNSSSLTGAIHSNGVLIVEGSTFIGNTSGVGGAGAIYTDGTATITNSTFSANNNAITQGGGFLTITSSTFGTNSSTVGAVYSYNGSATMTLRNSIFADSNVDINLAGTGTIIDQGYNIIETRSGTPFPLASTTVVGQDPKLSGLGFFGGPTQTYGLQTGSIALGAVPTGGSPVGTDQRGVARTGPSDIGAFESRASYTVTTTADYIPYSAADPRGVDGSLRLGLTITNAGIDEGRNINFNIATTDKGYNPVTGKWTITSVRPATLFNSGFDVFKPVVINGASQTPGFPGATGPDIIINANQLGTGFYINSGAGGAVTLNGLGITNGDGRYFPNFSTRGGGIYIDSGDVTLSNSLVYNNEASRGGAINVAAGASLLVSGTTISGNTSSQGGGIFSSGNLTITGSTLSNNTGSSQGGGIYNTGTLFSVTGSVISFNNASQGGGISTRAATTIDTTTVMANRGGAGGGGIFSYGGNSITITGSALVSNTSGDVSGGLYSYGALSLTDTIVASNSSAGDGGGLFLDAGSFSITRSTIASNSTGGRGGGIMKYDSTLTLDASVIASNRAAAGTGGGIYNGYGTINMTTTTVAGNTASTNGGGIENQGTLIIAGSHIVGNTASTNGGGIHSVLSDTTTPVTLTNTTVNGNRAASGGGIHSVRGAVTLTGSTVSFNKATSEGGGLFLTNTSGSSTATISGSRFEGNAAGSGGGVYTESRIALNISNSLITGNTASFGGGILSLAGNNTIALVSSTVSNNRAIVNGGGINADGGLSLLNSTVDNNRAGDAGAGIYFEGSTLSITGSTISNNTTTSINSFGGGVLLNGGSSSTITTSTFAGNQALRGGGIYLAFGTLALNSSTISQNTSRDATGGAGIYIGTSPGNTLGLANTIVAGNFGYDVAQNAGSLTDNGYNLLGVISSVSLPVLQPTTQTGVLNPGLAPLGNYGGPTQTMALLPGSLALGKGDPALNGTATDQRGVARNDGAPDIGAFESRGFAYTIGGGDNQSAVIGTAFAQSLVVTVTSLDPGLTDLTGGVMDPITLTVPGSGPTATGALTQPVIFAGGPGRATFNLSAGLELGTYQVGVAGAPSSVFFTLTNLGIPITILANADQGKTYGDADPASFGYTISAGPGVVLGGSLLRLPGEDVGGYLFEISDLAARNSKYVISLDPASPLFIIRPAVLTVTATAASGTSGRPFPILGGTITGFRLADTASVISGLMYSTFARDNSPSGTYAITPGGASARNYTFTYVSSLLTLAASDANPSMDLTAFNATLGRNNLDEEYYLFEGGYGLFSVSYEGKPPTVPSLLHVSSQAVVPTIYLTPAQP